MALDERLPTWVTWRRRPFPDANLVLLHGREPAVVDSGFVGHAEQTTAYLRATLDYDVGWVNIALDGPEAAATAVASLHRLADLAPRVLLPSHGPMPADPAAAFDRAVHRAQRLVDDPAAAAWYGARRIFGFALMIRGGLATDQVEPYLHARAWAVDAARLLGRTPEALASELVDSMIRGEAVVRDHRLHAAVEYTPVAPESLLVPYPRDWPSTFEETR